ncbi:unnamed protein product [Cuscuta campestris]|uniref:Uncharacterized protein n=1 Tax=Cuscuta campestris TaxID=132261 RepID=A0A484NFN8_9ASTE|nr:unnamed protein product [Cuscuta campestris]
MKRGRRREMLERLEFADRDYKSYLEIKYHIYGGGGCGGTIERGESPLGKDDEDCDPHYAMFLKHTKQKGNNAYVTTLEDDGLLTFIHYERDGSSSDEEGSYNHGSEVKSPRNGKCDSEGSRLEENMIDGDYKRYLEVRYGKDQEGCVGREDTPVTTLEDCGVRLSIHDEKEESCRDEKNDDCTIILTKDRKGDEREGNDSENVKGKRTNSGLPMVEEDEIFEPFTPLPTGERPKVSRTCAGNPNPPNVERAEPFTPLSIGKRAMFPELQKCNAKSKSNKKQRSSWSKVEERYVDQDYAILMRAVNIHREKYDSKTESQNKQDVEYDHDDSEDDVVEINYDTFCNGERSQSFSPQVHYCEVDLTCEPVYKGECPQFRQMVISELKKPFDQEEYEKLLQDVKEKKPVEKNLELRHGRDRTCPSSRVGKSYLEYHEDFKKKLEQAGPNKYEKLNILRGFFFWLQYAPNAGAFKPWNDPTCLAVMPG